MELAHSKYARSPHIGLPKHVSHFLARLSGVVSKSVIVLELLFAVHILITGFSLENFVRVVVVGGGGGGGGGGESPHRHKV